MWGPVHTEYVKQVTFYSFFSMSLARLCLFETRLNLVKHPAQPKKRQLGPLPVSLL